MEAKLRVKTETLPERCEVCHKADCFDPQTGHCFRCSELSKDRFIEKIDKKSRPVPIPLFLHPRTSKEKDLFHFIFFYFFLTFGWILFTASLFLPTIDEHSHFYSGPAILLGDFEGVNGILDGLAWVLIFPLIYITELFKDSEAKYIILLLLCNLILLSSPIMLFLKKNKKYRLYKWLIIFATLFVWFTNYIFVRPDFLIGYDVWRLSFVMVSLAFILNLNSKSTTL